MPLNRCNGVIGQENLSKICSLRLAVLLLIMMMNIMIMINYDNVSFDDSAMSNGIEKTGLQRQLRGEQQFFRVTFHPQALFFAN